MGRQGYPAEFRRGVLDLLAADHRKLSPVTWCTASRVERGVVM
jgi:hypothetical protein